MDFLVWAARLTQGPYPSTTSPQSVNYTKEFKNRYCHDDPQWGIVEASILDNEFMAQSTFSAIEVKLGSTEPKVFTVPCIDFTYLSIRQCVYKCFP